jgi:hypothetical protein
VPRPVSSGTSRRPMTPVAPARKIRITVSLTLSVAAVPAVPPLLEFLVVHVDDPLRLAVGHVAK